MKLKLSEWQKQACPEFDRRARAERKPNISWASFIERRLFYLNDSPYVERPEGFLEKPCSAAQTFGTVRNISN